ncbi:MAG TPA: hypothetical protein VF423_07370 [Actinomycetes bacterium]
MSNAPVELQPRSPVAGLDPASRPVTDRDLMVAAAAGAAAGGLVAAAVTARRPSPVRSISMGPGGWVSVRGSVAPRRIRTTNAPRPLWAHLLGARELRRRRGSRRSHV